MVTVMVYKPAAIDAPNPNPNPNSITESTVAVIPLLHYELISNF